MQALHRCSTTGLAITAATAHIIDPSLTDPAGAGMIGGRAVPRAPVFTDPASGTRAIARLATAARLITASRGPAVRDTAVRGTVIRVTTAGPAMVAKIIVLPVGNAPARRSGGMGAQEAGNVPRLAPWPQSSTDRNAAPGARSVRGQAGQFTCSYSNPRRLNVWLNHVPFDSAARSVS